MPARSATGSSRGLPGLTGSGLRVDMVARLVSVPTDMPDMLDMLDSGPSQAPDLSGFAPARCGH